MITPLIGDFGLSHFDGHVGRAIRFAQWLNGDGLGDCEHAFVYVGNGQIVEAMPKGARMVSIKTRPNAIYSTGLIPLSCESRECIADAAISYIGTKYSYLDYFSLVAKRLGIPIPHVRAYVKDTGHMICSQLVARCYYDAGRALYEGWTGDVTPGDLYQLLKSKGLKT